VYRLTSFIADDILSRAELSEIIIAVIYSIARYK